MDSMVVLGCWQHFQAKMLTVGVGEEQNTQCLTANALPIIFPNLPSDELARSELSIVPGNTVSEVALAHVSVASTTTTVAPSIEQGPRMIVISDVELVAELNRQCLLGGFANDEDLLESLLLRRMENDQGVDVGRDVLFDNISDVKDEVKSECDTNGDISETTLSEVLMPTAYGSGVIEQKVVIENEEIISTEEVNTQGCSETERDNNKTLELNSNLSCDDSGGGDELTAKATPKLVTSGEKGTLCRKKFNKRGLKIHKGVCKKCKLEVGVYHMWRHYKLKHIGELPFTCKRCRKGFKLYVLFHEHLLGCKPMYECRKCNLTFPTAPMERLHRLTLKMHGPSNPQKKQTKKAKTTVLVVKDELEGLHNVFCSICNMKLPIGLLDSHSQKLHPNIDKTPFKCGYCLKDFQGATIFRYHVLVHPKSVKCGKCSLRFFVECQILRHRKICHKTPPSKKLQVQKIKHLKVKQTKTRKCVKKSNIKKRGVGLLGRSSVHNGICNICNVQFTLQDLQRHYRVEHSNSDRKAFECPTCDKSYSGQTQFTLHMRNHTNPSHYRCDICDLNFKDNVALKEHKEGIHSNQKYPCTECGVVLKTQARFKMHMRLEHSTSSYICDACGLSFKNRRELYLHRLVEHSNRFNCDICGKKLRSVFSVENHKSIFHNVRQKADATFETSIDRKRETQAVTLNIDMSLCKKQLGENIYSGFCGKCNKKMSVGRIPMHYRLEHTGEVPFHCSNCYKGYRDYRAFYFHKFGRPKEFCCKECNLNFPTQFQKEKHRKLVHRDTLPVVSCRDCDLKFSTVSQKKKHRALCH